MAGPPETGVTPPGAPGGRVGRALGRVTPVASLLIIVLGLLDLLRWQLAIEGVLQAVPFLDVGVMMPNTAVGLLLCGAALWLLRAQGASSGRRAAGRMLAGAAALVGLLTLIEYVAGVDPGIDRLLVPEGAVPVGERAPGRPAPSTALSLLTAGAALGLLDVETRRGRRPAQVLALISGFFGVQSLAGYGYRQEILVAPGFAIGAVPAFMPMALHTAVSFVALALGVLCARPGRGIMALFTGSDFGAFVARRLLPAAILVPLLLGWLRLVGEEAGLYGTAVGTSLLVVATIVAFTALIGWNAAVVRRLDLGRTAAEAALRESEARYQTLVETAYEGIWVLDRQQRTAYANRRMADMLGCDPEVLVGRSLFDFVASEDRAEADRFLERRMAGIQEVHEFCFRRCDGAPLWVLMSTAPLEDEDGRYTGALAMATEITERKRAEAALRESEARFRAVFERAGIGIVLADTEGRILEANPVLQRLLGYPADELIGVRFTELSHPEDVDLDWRLFEELLAGKRDAYRIEKRYLRKDGAVVWGRLTGSLVRDPGGRFQYGLGMLEDITEWRRAEEERRRLIAILEATPDFVGTAEVDGRVRYLNRAGRAAIGIGEEEDVGHLFIADLHPLWAAARILGEGIPTAMREGAWSGETAVRTRDGREIPVSQVVVAHRDRSGVVAYLSTVVRDISERKRREADEHLLLEASRVLSGTLDEEEILRGVAHLLVPSRADACVIDRLDPAGGVRRAMGVHREPAGQAVLDELGHFPPSLDEGIGVSRALRTGRPELVVEVTEAWLRAVGRSEEHRDLLHRLGPRSALIVPLRVRDRVIGAITLARTTPGEPYGPDDVGVAGELAARTALALDNARLYREARQATHVRDEVLRVVAHDLRSPLQTIGLSVGLVQETLPASMAEEHRQLEIVERSVERANGLIRDLLEVARMEAGRLTVEPVPLDPAALVREVIDLHGALAAQKALRLNVDLAEDLAPVAADRGRILQVLSNLVGNAIKFTPEGGCVSVRAERADGEVCISVMDTGPGIGEEDRAHVFDPFWQARSGHRGGAGLGLAIARGIVEAHGGRIGLRSRVGVGSTFWFTLPVAG